MLSQYLLSFICLVNEVEKTNGRIATRERNTTVRDERLQNRNQYSKPVSHVPLQAARYLNPNLVPVQQTTETDANLTTETIEDYIESEDELAEDSHHARRKLYSHRMLSRS
jgi:hypothetical protein